MKFKLGDTVAHVTDQNTKFYIVALIQVQTSAGTENKYLGRQFHQKESPHWPGISTQPVELTEMELADVWV